VLTPLLLIEVAAAAAAGKGGAAVAEMPGLVVVAS
jgi:hypothetical protein